MVVTTFYNGVDLRDKVKRGEVIAKDINGKRRIKAFAMTLLPMTKNSVLSWCSFNFLLYTQSWTDTREFFRLWIESLKLDVLKELCTCVSSAYRWYLISLALDRTELRGVVYIINRSGPSTEPWGKPKISLMGLDRVDEIRKDWQDVWGSWPPNPVLRHQG